MGQAPSRVTRTPAHLLESWRSSYYKRRKERPDYDAKRKAKWLNSLKPERRKQIIREQSARICANLTDGYIRGLLRQQLNVPVSSITPEQIIEKRKSLQSKRIRWALKKSL